MYQFVICEDDAQQRDHLQKLIKKTYGGQPVFCYDDVDTLLEELPHIPAPRIIFMDIVLKTRSGIEAAAKIAPADTAIIFITAYLDKVVDIFEAPHTYFIYKPDLEVRLAPAVEKAMKQLNDHRRRIVLQMRDKKVVAEAADILRLERTQRTTEIRCRKESYHVSDDLDHLLARLPDSFVRCHRSYAVNLDAVKIYRRNELILTDGTLVPIGRSYCEHVRKKFQEHAARNMSTEGTELNKHEEEDPEEK